MSDRSRFTPLHDRRRRWFAALGAYGLLVLLAAPFTLPYARMFFESIRPLDLPPPTTLEWLPARVTLENYTGLFGILPLARYAANSLAVVAVGVPLTLVFASWAGFALAQLPPRPRGVLVSIVVATLLVPLMSLWLTRFLVFKWLGVLDTLVALMLPSLMGGSPFYVLMLYWAFRRLPRDLVEAARLDGCGAFRIWWSIALPLVRPTLSAVAVLSFVLYWSNFLDPLLFINRQQNYTLPLALQALQQMHPSRWPILMAACVMVTLPVVLVFLVAQRHFLQEHHPSDVLSG
jgi:multiple sugar transport system permease protein